MTCPVQTARELSGTLAFPSGQSRKALESIGRLRRVRKVGKGVSGAGALPSEIHPQFYGRSEFRRGFRIMIRAAAESCPGSMPRPARRRPRKPVATAPPGPAATDSFTQRRVYAVTPSARSGTSTYIPAPRGRNGEDAGRVRRSESRHMSDHSPPNANASPRPPLQPEIGESEPAGSPFVTLSRHCRKHGAGCGRPLRGEVQEVRTHPNRRETPRFRGCPAGSRARATHRSARSASGRSRTGGHPEGSQPRAAATEIA